MIIRQALNFGANLVAGLILGAFAIGMMRACRCASSDRLEPRRPPAPESTAGAETPESPGGAAAI
jgi:hypothetical protein